LGLLSCLSGNLDGEREPVGSLRWVSDVFSESGVDTSVCWSWGRAMKREATYMKMILSSGLDMHMSVRDKWIGMCMDRWTDKETDKQTTK
jgi:hypothetical protein